MKKVLFLLLTVSALIVYSCNDPNDPEDKNIQWIGPINVANPEQISRLITTENVVFYTSDYLYKSIDFGENWVCLKNTPFDIWMTHVLQKDNSNNIYFESHQDNPYNILQYYSTDNGEQWEQFFLPDSFKYSPICHVSLSGNLIAFMIGKQTNHFFVSKDKAKSWSLVKLPEDLSIIIEIVNMNNDSVLIVDDNKYLWVYDINKNEFYEKNVKLEGEEYEPVYFYQNFIFYGKTLSKIDLNGIVYPVDDIGYYRIERIANSKNGDLWAGTNSGLFRSTDIGKTWNKVPSDLTSYIDLVAVTDNGYLFIGYFNTIYRSKNKIY